MKRRLDPVEIFGRRPVAAVLGFPGEVQKMRGTNPFEETAHRGTVKNVDCVPDAGFIDSRPARQPMNLVSSTPQGGYRMPTYEATRASYEDDGHRSTNGRILVK